MAAFRPWGEFFDTSRLASGVDAGRVGPNVRFWLYNYLAAGAVLAVAVAGAVGPRLGVLLAVAAVAGHALLHVPSAQNRIQTAAAGLNEKIGRRVDDMARRVDEKMKSF